MHIIQINSVFYIALFADTIMEQSTAASILFCSYCDFECYSHSALLNHIKFIHQDDPQFKISCMDCGKTFKKWCTLKKHLHRDHRDSSFTQSG